MLRIPVLLAVVCGALALASDGVGPSEALPSEAIAPRSTSDVPQELSACDWSSIRATYEANRHAAFAVAGGYQARNPGQQWLTRFDGRGFSTEPDAGGWTWGLQLERYGFAGQERAVNEPTQVTAAGQRVAYEWDATLQEWYVNEAHGLEHGYTVRQRPPREQVGPLTFTLAVRGGLAAQVQADGCGVRFVNDDGAAVLTYAGLSVFDADGQLLAARFEPLAEGLLLTIDERGARYPLTIDPIAQQAYLKASNTGSSDGFGYWVSVSGDTVVVGAGGEDSNATGVNGDQSNDTASVAGAAYVFVRSGTSWSQQAYLKASNTGIGDAFGISVAVSGDTMVVGAWQEKSNATGVNGDQSNDSAPYAGAAYVFVRSGTSWSQQAYLKASNTGATDTFAYSVSVSGDTVVVGARGESSNATGVNGDQSDNSEDSAGAAYVIELDLDAWVDLGSGLAGSSGVPLLVGTGTLSANSSNQLQLINANPSSAATLIFGVSQLNAPFKGGTLVPAPLLLVPLVTNPAGALSLPFTWPPNVPAGTALYFQFWISDPGAIFGLSASNALEGVSS